MTDHKNFLNYKQIQLEVSLKYVSWSILSKIIHKILTRQYKKLFKAYFKYILVNRQIRALYKIPNSNRSSIIHYCPHLLNVIFTFNVTLPVAICLWQLGLWLTGNVSESAVSPPGNIPLMSHNFQEVHILFPSLHCHKSQPNSSSFRDLHIKYNVFLLSLQQSFRNIFYYPLRYLLKTTWKVKMVLSFFEVIWMHLVILNKVSNYANTRDHKRTP